MDIRVVDQSLVNKAVLTGYENKIVGLGKIVDFDLLLIMLFNRFKVKDKPIRRFLAFSEKVITQRFDYDCGWGAFSTLMLFLGREDVLKTDLYKRLEVDPHDGTRIAKFKDVLDEEKIPFFEVANGDITDLENVINGGGVALVSYQAWGEVEEIEKLECGHYSIVFDVDESYVWLIDPSWEPSWEDEGESFGKGVVRRSRDEFANLWIDKEPDGVVYKSWMLVVRI